MPLPDGVPTDSGPEDFYDWVSGPPPSLLAFHDWRAVDDGEPALATNGSGSWGSVAITDLNSLSALAAQPLYVTNGAIRPLDSEAVNNMVPIYSLGTLPSSWSVHCGLADFESQSSPGAGTANIVVVDASGNGPVAHATGDGATPVTKITVGVDVLSTYEEIDSVNMDRLLGAGDRVTLSALSATSYAVYVNGEQVLTMTQADVDAAMVSLDLASLDLVACPTPCTRNGVGSWVSGWHWWAMSEGVVDFDPDAPTVRVAPKHSGADLTERIKALSEPYTPTTSADWDGPPATVGAALDELAQRIKILEGS